MYFAINLFQLFSPLLEGGQFLFYLIAQAQNAVPLKPTTPRTLSLIYDYF